MLFLLACADAPEKANPTDPGCPDPTSLVITGEPTPGATLQVEWAGADEVVWTVSDGSITPTDSGATWQLPTDIAKDQAEILTVQADMVECDAATAEVSVDWPEGQRVVVVYNPSVDRSEEVARTYAAFRGVTDLCPIVSASPDVLAEAEVAGFVSTLTACLQSHTHYLVPVYGVPYKVEGRIADISGSGVYTTTSLDALLFLGEDAATQRAALYNPVYQDGDSSAGSYSPYLSFGEWKANNRGNYYLVTRIDGADADAALDLIARTEAAEALGALAGTVYVDGNRGDTPPTTDEPGSYEAGEWNMWGTRYVFEEDGRYPVVWDGNSEEFGTAPAPLTCPDALYYAGWYSYYNYNDAFTWATGAIGGHLDSCSACDIRSSATWSGGALQRGITATFGAVNEPYVAGMPEYDQFFLYLLQGANFAEAAYESTWIGAWMMVWIGDPLYRPYPSLP